MIRPTRAARAAAACATAGLAKAARAARAADRLIVLKVDVDQVDRAGVNEHTAAHPCTAAAAARRACGRARAALRQPAAHRHAGDGDCAAQYCEDAELVVARDRQLLGARPCQE